MKSIIGMSFQGIIRFMILSFVMLFSGTGYTQSIDAGLRIQKTQGMYWENGLSIQYQFANFKPERFLLGFDYITSRLGTAYNSNAIKQDNFLVSGSWLFNKTKAYHIAPRLNVGYFYSDLEFEIFDEVPNTSFLLSPELGIRYHFKELPIKLNLGSGYYILTAKEGYSPGTLQPLYFHFDICYTLLKNKSNE